ncbi:MAG: hypothetical protein Q4F05_17195 [bacterium]|nr:hypothetical protein [bacterium]
MSRIGTKKPPIKNAYYAPQEHVPVFNGNAKAGSKAMFTNGSSWAKDDYKYSYVDKE